MEMLKFIPLLRMAAMCALLFVLTGCPSVQHEKIDEELGRSTWAAMQELNAKAVSEAGPYNASLSFRLKTPSEGAMLGAYVWSNGRVQGHHPLRLDLQSSVGSSVAKIKEESDHFLIYDIVNKTAIISRNPQEALASYGLPLPFSIADISLLLNGRYLDFFTGGSTATPELNATTQERHSVFKISEGPRQGYLTLNARGYPVAWRGLGDTPWNMNITYQDVASLVANITPLPGPYRLNISHPDGYSVSINVKTLKKFPIPFTPAQLELSVPSSAKVLELKGK